VFQQTPTGTFALVMTVQANRWGSGPVAAPQAGARFGEALATGDVDGDGLLDLVIGAPGQDPSGGVPGGIPSAGAVYVLRNTGANGFGAPFGPFFDGAAAAGARFGAALAVGRLDGDGIDDVLVGAPVAPAGAIGAAGRVAVLTGSASPPHLVTNAALAWSSSVPTSGAQFGAAVAAADLTGDGFDEAVAGAPFQRTAAGGFVEVFGTGLDRPGGLLASALDGGSGLTGTAEFGAALVAADLDGDGDDEVLAGSPEPTGAGHVTILSSDRGNPLGLVHQHLVPVPGFAGAGARFGDAVAVGFVDGGRAPSDLDVVVGAPLAFHGGLPGAGEVTLFRGRPLVAVGSEVVGASAPAAGEAFGSAVAIGEVLDPATGLGDGFGDLVVGVPLRAGGAGGVEVVRSTAD
jgi:hypothetical protein